MDLRVRILDVSERRPFRTIYEAINWCVGTEYKYWGRACWPNYHPTDGFRMWFTQLAYIEKGRYVPAAFDCINLICCNGNYHVFDKVNPQKPDSMTTQTWKYDLIFSKEVGGYYYFRGVFVADEEHSAMHHYVSKRVATKARLIGCPARRLELLDSVDAGEFDENYLKNRIVSSDVVDLPLSSKPRAVMDKPPVKQFIAPKKKAPVKPKKISDNECLKLFPINCRVYHKSFGFGTVNSIKDAIISISFDISGEKDLGVDFCINNKLLEKV
jgi:hypothetical protein